MFAINMIIAAIVAVILAAIVIRLVGVNGFGQLLLSLPFPMLGAILYLVISYLLATLCTSMLMFGAQETETRYIKCIDFENALSNQEILETEITDVGNIRISLNGRDVKTTFIKSDSRPQLEVIRKTMTKKFFGIELHDYVDTYEVRIPQGGA